MAFAKNKLSISCRGKRVSKETIERNLSQIQEEIVPYKPNIIAVTKYFDESAIVQAFDAGLRHFGESRVIEAIEKINNLPKEVKNNSKFHFIGHLQSNKVRKVVENFDYIHSVDSLKLAELISEEALKSGKIQNVFLQLNNAEEEQKFGFSKEELFEVFESIQKLSGLKIAGLMNMAPFGVEEKVLEDLFTDVASTKEALEKQYNCKMDDISMGMSSDYKVAARCGSTMLRVGRKLFSK